MIAGLMFGVAVAMGLGWFAWYNSPFTVMLALSVFHLMKRMKLNERMSAVVSAVSPSIFPIYILHANSQAYAAMKELAVFQFWGILHTPPVLVPVLSVLVFSIALFVDFVRRGVMFVIKNLIARKCR